MSTYTPPLPSPSPIDDTVDQPRTPNFEKHIRVTTNSPKPPVYVPTSPPLPGINEDNFGEYDFELTYHSALPTESNESSSLDEVIESSSSSSSSDENEAPPTPEQPTSTRKRPFPNAEYLEMDRGSMIWEPIKFLEEAIISCKKAKFSREAASNLVPISVKTSADILAQARDALIQHHYGATSKLEDMWHLKQRNAFVAYLNAAVELSIAKLTENPHIFQRAYEDSCFIVSLAKYEAILDKIGRADALLILVFFDENCKSPQDWVTINGLEPEARIAERNIINYIHTLPSGTRPPIQPATINFVMGVTASILFP